MVKRWLQEGNTKEQAKELLIAHCQTLAATQLEPASAPKPAVVSNNDQRPTNNEQVKPNNDYRSTVNAPSKLKQARYLSTWKVKRNGRLHIPKPASQRTSRLE